MKQMKTIFIGIDPGKSGGIACIDTEKSLAYTEPYNDKALIDLCSIASHCNQDVVCCLEKVGARPGQGVVSMFSFGQSVGYIKGVLEAFRIPYQEITPQKWKREFGLNSEKAASAEVCRKLFPDISLLATPKCKKPHDGMAEALLMAEYARRKL
jgi:crossover junction endodeoxyribonuclease RuvC